MSIDGLKDYIFLPIAGIIILVILLSLLRYLFEKLVLRFLKSIALNRTSSQIISCLPGPLVIYSERFF